MAKHILYNASVVLNSVDLSDHTRKISFVTTIIDQPANAMADLEEYSMPGLRKVSPISLEMFQDFASSKVYATIMTLWTNRTTFTAVMKLDSGAVAATNPSFTVSVYVSSFPVIDGSHGDAHMTAMVLAPAGVMVIATS